MPTARSSIGTKEALLPIEMDDASLSQQDDKASARQSLENGVPPSKPNRGLEFARRLSRAHPPSKFSRFYRKCKIMIGKVYQLLKQVGEHTSNYMTSVFTLPLVRGDPISYVRPEDFNAAGQQIENKDQEEYEKKMDLIEAACNYDDKTKALFEKVIADRKDFAANKKRYTKDVDWNKLAPWNESFLGHLESTFQAFDASSDHLIDFEELSVVLTDYGDKTPAHERQKVFSQADTSKRGVLTFTEFVTMFHAITVKSPDSYPSTIVESFRAMDRNMARVRGLDVVQQLQAGLF